MHTEIKNKKSITFVSRIFRNGETDAEFGVNDVNNDDVDICDGVVAGGGVDDEDRDVSKVADD